MLSSSLMFLLLLVVSLQVGVLESEVPPQVPVIGIYTQEDEYDEPSTKEYLNTYISAAYVKFIEMSGAQVVPIFAFGNEQQILDQLRKINGVLFTGGAGQTEIHINNTWTRNANFILGYAMGQNKKGNPFPIWGTCLGLQLLSYLTSGFDQNIITPIRGEQRVFNTLIWRDFPSYLYDDLNDNLRNKLTHGQGILYFNHQYALTDDKFRANSKMAAFWKRTSICKTVYNQVFVSTLEAKQYPFFACQFHPEKNLYEWKVFADRTAEGAEIAQILSNKFVEVARKNKNSYSGIEELSKSVIYQYQPTTKTTLTFMMIYPFQEPRPSDMPFIAASQATTHLQVS